MSDLQSRVRALAAGPHPEPPAGLADAALHRARRRTTRRRAGVIAGTAVLAAVLVVAVNVVTGALSTSPQPGPAAPSGLFAKARDNVLLLGVDSRPERVGTRPDSIILASIDTRTGATSLFSFPRNLGHAPFAAGSPGAEAFPDGFTCGKSVATDTCMLNAVWTWAESTDAYSGVPDPGLTATTDAIEGISGLTVDDTVVVTIQGLVDLVNAIGGVTVDVPERLPRGGHADATPAQGSYYTEATQGYLEPGRRKLDGFDAMWFARSRRTTDDYSRMRRQRCLVQALVQQTDAVTVAKNWPAIAGALGRNLTTSIGLDEFADWVTLAGRMKSAPLRSVVFDNKKLDNQTWQPDFDHIRSTIRASLAAATPPPSSTSPSATTGADRDAC